MDTPLTLAQAAEFTGVTAKALARRIERGTLRGGKNQNGHRTVTRRALAEVGLLDLATDRPPAWSGVLPSGDLAEAVIRELTARGIRIADLEARVEELAAQIEEQRQVNAAQEAEIRRLAGKG